MGTKTISWEQIEAMAITDPICRRMVELVERGMSKEQVLLAGFLCCWEIKEENTRKLIRMMELAPAPPFFVLKRPT